LYVYEGVNHKQFYYPLKQLHKQEYQHYGGLDERVNAGIPAYEVALKDNKIAYELYVYEGVNHGFHNNTTPRYDEKSAMLSWTRTIDFFKEKLKKIVQATAISATIAITSIAGVLPSFMGMGADAVGMSTVPETMVCNYMGMKVLAVSCITNMATGIQTVKHSHARVLEIANQAGDTLCRWLGAVIQRME
jgi:hypothetical protein